MNDGETWCEDHFASHGFHCDECGENFDNEHKHESGMCTTCAEANVEQLTLDLVA
jgi:formylmethanofuran dehydrogenase subunit E